MINIECYFLYFWKVHVYNKLKHMQFNGFHDRINKNKKIHFLLLYLLVFLIHDTYYIQYVNNILLFLYCLRYTFLIK